MKVNIKSGKGFQVVTSSITMQVDEDYTYKVYLSADGITYSQYKTEEYSDKVLVVNGLTPQTFIKFGEDGDNKDLIIIY